MKKQVNLGLLILRLAVGCLMLLHGIAKLKHGIPGIEGMVESHGLPTFLAYGVYVGEVVAPLLIIVGYKTRLAALVLFFNCIVATSLAHGGQIFSLNETGGWALELLGLYGFGALALFFTGAGSYAVASRGRWD
ncbi:putative oxidoreductase [Balneicella halophila]|uniref:Putative oxidoreductase n=1 Tax=Balneicella halophila TaxID=1537566 RepID=A0A7L4UR46_BALHA|nr:DoxX family protein [Balneicella halophila]PVX52223.1 putative oxidoreductase [Balneicella halophila]